MHTLLFMLQPVDTCYNLHVLTTLLMFTILFVKLKMLIFIEISIYPRETILLIYIMFF